MLQNRILTQNFSQNLIFKTENNVPVGKLLEKNMGKIFFLHFKITE
jgi:hypothetical protein